MDYLAVMVVPDAYGSGETMLFSTPVAGKNKANVIRALKKAVKEEGLDELETEDIHIVQLIKSRGTISYSATGEKVSPRAPIVVAQWTQAAGDFNGL